MNVEELRIKLSESGLKVTPQRLHILHAVYELDNHPTAEQVHNFIKKSYPSIARGTVYNVLETFVDNNLVKKVKTEKDIFRYDGILDRHHHLYCSECDMIRDYVDEELDLIIKEYFKNKKIKGFKMEDIVLQIRGKFDQCYFFKYKSKYYGTSARTCATGCKYAKNW